MMPKRKGISCLGQGGTDMEQLRYSLREAQPELLPNSMFEPWHLFDMEPMEHSNERAGSWN